MLERENSGLDGRRESLEKAVEDFFFLKKKSDGLIIGFGGVKNDWNHWGPSKTKATGFFFLFGDLVSNQTNYISLLLI